MSWKHTSTKKFSLHEYAIQQRRLHKRVLSRLGKGGGNQVDSDAASDEGDAVDTSDEEEGAAGTTTTTALTNGHNNDEDDELLEAEHELNGYYFLQPVPIRQRRALLRQAGVKRIDSYEKDE